MAAPAAILSIMVKAQGAQAAIGQLNGVDAAARKAGSGVDTLEKKSAKGRAALDKVGKGAGIVAGGVALIGAAAVNSAAKYEQSMNTLQAVSGSTAGEMRKLSKLSIKLGADVRLPGTSAQDAAEAMTEMIKAGVSLKDTMAGVRSTLVLSAAAGVSNKDAAMIAANALNTFKLAGKDVAFVADQLANTANASSVEIKDVADAMKMAGAVFNGLQSPVLGAKGALTELNVAVGLLGNAGIRGSDAGTSLKQMLLQLTGPTDRAKGAMQALYFAAKGNAGAEGELTGALRGTAKERAAALESLRKLNPALKGGGDIAYDSAGKMRSLKDIIALVTAGTKTMTQEQKNAYITQIFGADATRSVLTLMNAGPAAFDKMTGAVTRQGAAQALADAKMKGFKGSMEALKSTLETLAINVGTKLLPALTALVKQLSAVAGALSPTAWLVLIGVIGTLAVSVFTINAAFKVYAAGQIAVTAATWLWNAALAATAGEMTIATGGLNLIIPALIALGVGLVVAYKKSETFRNIVNGAFNAIKSVAQAVFPVVKKMAEFGLLGPIALIIARWGQLKSFLSGAWKSISGGMSSFATDVKNKVVGAFQGALSAVVGFVNAIIGVINKIPGVNIGKIAMPQNTEGNAAGGKGKFGPNFARGGAFGLTGGVVNAPMVMMGEEAPTHPEFVIPTNPAYRKRAQSLLAQAAGTIGGMAKGGILGAIGGAIAGGAKGLLGKFPGVGDLPSWMKGLGSFVLGKVGSFIKDKVTDILPGGGGAPGRAGGPAGTAVFKGITMAKWVAEAMRYAQSKGVESQPTSGYRPGAITINGTPSEHRGLQYPHGAVDFGSFTSGLGAKMAVVNATSDFKWPLLAPIGFRDDGHASGTGHRKGGIIKAFRKGGILGLAEGGSSPPFFIPGMGEAMPRVMSEKAKANRERARKARLKAMREKQHPRWQGHWEQQVNRKGGVIKAFAQGGINTAIAAARKAGFTGEALVRMIAIAGRESNYNPRAKNLVPPDHSIGLWQINQLAHHGRFGSDAELMNPDTNARAAWILSGHGHNFSPWSTNRGLSQGLIDRARQAVAAFKGGSGTSGGGGGAATGGGSAAQRVNPLDQKIANADLAIEQAKRGPIKIGGVGGRKISSAMQQVGALTSKRKLVGARIRSIRKALKGKVSPAKRLALTQELTQRLSEHAQLGTDIAGLMAAPTTGGDGGSIGDIGGGGATGDTSDPNQPLIDSNAALQASIDAQAQAARDQAQALADVQAELKRQTDFATTVQSTETFQLKKMLADVVSGQIGGYGVAPKAHTPGSGVAYRY